MYVNKVYKNTPKHRSRRGVIGALQALFPSFPHPEPLHLQYLNMSGASVLAGAHHFVARDNMFINTNTVSRM